MTNDFLMFFFKVTHWITLLKLSRCEDIILGCTHNTIKYSSKHCCNRFFGTERYFTDSATLCISTHNMPPLQELFVSQIYGFTVYLKTAGSHTRFGNNSAKITHFIRIYSHIILKWTFSMCRIWSIYHIEQRRIKARNNLCSFGSDHSG